MISDGGFVSKVNRTARLVLRDVAIIPSDVNVYEWPLRRALNARPGSRRYSDTTNISTMSAARRSWRTA